MPGQLAGGHCACVGQTESTSFPRAVRKGIRGEQENLDGWKSGVGRIAAIRSACKKEKEGRQTKTSESSKSKGGPRRGPPETRGGVFCKAGKEFGGRE